ncbi:alpha-amidating enzyme precursor 2 [Biomphalaria glabrata]
MFYTNSSVADSSEDCKFNELTPLTGDNFPKDVSVPLPPNPALEEAAIGSRNHPGELPLMCKNGQSSIMFAWAKNAPPTVMPKGVGLRIGSKTSIQTIVVQVHYAKVFKDSEPEDHSGLKFYTTHQKPQYVAGIFLLAAGFTIPPHVNLYPVDISCTFGMDKSIFPFAYRTHSHGLGC